MMTPFQAIFFSGSPRMAKIKAIVDEVAKTDVTVLIKGESGTGKELVAEAIHLSSPRWEKPFVRVNCAAIPRGLLESELFGFEKGAFTGAHLMKPGKFELGNGGTVLLNDISDIDISVQAKLLQVLQEGAFSRLGGNGEVKVDDRIITTTRDDLERFVARGLFREDLFFRINVISIAIPPLRERRDQIIPFSNYFFEHYGKKYRRPISLLSLKTLETFSDYQWPGNIRELENVIKRIVILGNEDAVVQESIRKKMEGGAETVMEGDSALAFKEAGKRAAATAEGSVIQGVLEETHWNRKEAARVLGVSYKSLLYRIQKYRLDERK
jgi:two-component system response regulator AtoC